MDLKKKTCTFPVEVWNLGILPVKCYSSISVRLWIFSVKVRNINKHFWCRCWRLVVVYLRTLFVIFFFSLILPLPLLPSRSLPVNNFFTMEQQPIFRLSTPTSEFYESPPSSEPILSTSYEFHPGFIAMVREQSFLGLKHENPYHHLWEFV